MDLTLLPIISCTDPLMRKPSTDVEDMAEARALGADMIHTMRAHKGVGLAAVQVARPLRMFVMVDFLPGTNTFAHHPRGGEKVLINPAIIDRSDDMVTGEEGCLSMPSVYFPVERHREVTVEYTKPDGTRDVIYGKGSLSVCMQHEIDHLDGIRNIDRVSRLKRDMLLSEFKKKSKQAMLSTARRLAAPPVRQAM